MAPKGHFASWAIRATGLALKLSVLMLLDEFLSLGRVEKLVHALAYMRGWGIRIATVIQSEAQLQAVCGWELVEFFIDNHRAQVYYRPRCIAGTWPSRSSASTARRRGSWPARAPWLSDCA